MLNNVDGAQNTATGDFALRNDVSGTDNTATGSFALENNTSGNDNTADGGSALNSNTEGSQNTAIGFAVLASNVTGEDNNAVGATALFNNINGTFNNAHGRSALNANDGSENNAFGDLAMEFNTTGSQNIAIGDDALRNNTDGSGNVAVGDEAGTGLGPSVNNCIATGVPGGAPFATSDNTCFIGGIVGQAVSDPGTQAAVFVDQFNVVGIFNSSRKYKRDVEPMDKASETLYRLKPVTFKFNSDWKGTTQYGLIAEDVAQVNPQLVVSRNAETITVRYEQINAMLLNEFLKEHKIVQEQGATIAELRQQVEALTAGLQKVTAQLEVNNLGAQTVVNNQQEEY